MAPRIDNQARFHGALEGGLGAFWAAVSGAYPEVQSGDMAPDMVARLEAAASDALRAWIDANPPAPTRPDWIYGDPDTATFLAPETIAEMRAWIADCDWQDIEPDEIAELEPADIVAGIRRNYVGGINAFLEAI